MRVTNTAEGWKNFADQMWELLEKGGDRLRAEIYIAGELDPEQLSSLQYGLLEFDRIEAVLRRQIRRKQLRIYTNSLDDAYRILHYFRIICYVRNSLEISVFQNNRLVKDSKEYQWSISLGRIFPLLCVGKSSDNRSIAPYSLFALARSPEEVRRQMDALFKNGTPAPAGETLESIIEYYIMDRTLQIFKDLSGTQGKGLLGENRENVEKALQDILLAQMPELSLLTRLLWTISLWTMALSKDLLALKENGKIWELDLETVHCSRLDAISYGEGLLQLLENACIHSDMRRAYLSIRIHRTDVITDNTVNLAEAAQSRLALRSRIQRLTGEDESKLYQLRRSVKYCFEFQVTNDSLTLDHASAGPRKLLPLRGLAARFFTIQGMEWPRKTDYGLSGIFQETLLPEEVRNNPEHMAQHYGLHIFEKTVRLNDGYFYVSSSGMGPDGKPRLDRYQSFGSEREGEDLPPARLERYTLYLILLPIFPHWHSTDNGEEKDNLDRGELFAPAGLTRDYHQRILRFHILEKEGEEPEMEFLEADCLQSPDMAASSGFPTRWIDPKNKMEMIRLLYGSLVKGLGRADDGTVCLLDLVEARHYSQIELLAKMLFLFITGWGVEELKKRPCLFALILPAKEQIWEFVRIFSIFYDKLNGRLMEAQIAVCVYPELEDARGDTVQKRVKVPEVAFFLAGGASSTARVTARTFAYYNTGSTVETIPQLRYLTRGTGSGDAGVPQFPFDLFLSAGTAPSEPEGKAMSWFLRHMDGCLNRELWRRGLGCRIRGIKVRLKSNILLEDFYEAELLFHNIGVIYRFAYLITRDLLRQLRKRPQDRLLLVGYENYSSVLVEQIVRLLQKNPLFAGEVQYMIYSGQSPLGRELHHSPELQIMEESRRQEFLQQAACVTILPIGATMSTLYRIQNAVRDLAEGGEKRFKLENYVLILVGCQGQENVSSMSDRYWKQQPEPPERPGLIRLEPDRAGGTQAFARFFLSLHTSWTRLHEADLLEPLREKALVYVDQTSTIPRNIFVGEDTRFCGISKLIGESRAKQENNRRAELLKGCVYYGHLTAGGNHFQFYFDMDQYYAKANRPLEGVSPKTRKLCVAQWLRTLRDTVDSNAYNIIVSPLHQEDSPFAKAVTDQVFEHSLRFLHIDFTDTFREDIRAKFGYVAEEYARIKRFDQAKNVNVYFVNTAITSGDTLRRARNLMIMLLEESGMAYDRENVFRGCFVLINRSGYDTLNSYIEEPGQNFHAYLHLAVPSLNLRWDRCPTCELVEQYRTIEQRCSSLQLRREFRRLAEKHKKRNLFQHMEWMRDSAMTNASYAARLCQWIGDLDGNAGSEAAKSRWAGVFQLSRQEFLQLQNLRKLLIWGRNRFLELRGLKLEEEEEAWLEVLSGFSLRDLETLVEKDREGALASMGDLGDEVCLSPDTWCRAATNYACGQRNYMRLMSTHQAFLASEKLKDMLKGKTLEERAAVTKDLLLDLICNELKKEKKLAVKAEWLISYLKVLSRPHLAQYHHIRQGILSILLQLAAAAVQDGPLPEEKDPRQKELCSYLKKEGKLSPLLRYQLLETVLKRLACLQSIYLLRKDHQLQVLRRISSLREEYFAQLRELGKSSRQNLECFPPEREIEITMVKLVKWASSCGDDENGCYLIERQFREENLADGSMGVGGSPV